MHPTDMNMNRDGNSSFLRAVPQRTIGICGMDMGHCALLPKLLVESDRSNYRKWSRIDEDGHVAEAFQMLQETAAWVCPNPYNRRIWKAWKWMLDAGVNYNYLETGDSISKHIGPTSLNGCINQPRLDIKS